MCSCKETNQFSSENEESESNIESTSNNAESANDELANDQETLEATSPLKEKNIKDLLSRKFIAFIVSLIVTLSMFLLVYLQTKDLKTFGDFLHNNFLLLAVYIGGNSLEKLTRLKK